MISSFTVKNFKSLHEVMIEPGHFNVFIGANGCGKSNVLEALALLAGAMTGRTTPEDLFNRGYRVARPDSTRSSFREVAQQETISLIASEQGTWAAPDGTHFDLVPSNTDSIAAEWVNQKSGTMEPVDVESVLRGLKELESKLAPDHAKFPIVLAEIRRSLSALETHRSLSDFVIYTPNTLALRGLQVVSQRTPIGIHGEGLDQLIASLSEADHEALAKNLHMIDWFDEFLIDVGDQLKYGHHKMGRSQSRLYFRDRFMHASNDLFSAENANEGILHLLFHLSVFLSAETPQVFGVDNLETALNPQLCRLLTASLASLAVERNKQAFVTTHNPAVLDGINLHDDRQRLFVVHRNGEGHTTVKRLTHKPSLTEGKYKLSELWMRGHLGGLPDAF